MTQPVSRRDRTFLDANVLFSAAYRADAGLSRLWRLRNVELFSSSYAVEEARRNLAIVRLSAIERFQELIAAISIVATPQGFKLPDRIRIDPKDLPILLAAVQAKANFLLTGDGRHFGHLFGKRVEDVMILRPAQYLEGKRKERRAS